MLPLKLIHLPRAEAKKKAETDVYEEVKLTPKEFELLVLFVRNVNITLFKDKIFETIWETEWQPESRTVDLHVKRLRKKLDLKDNLKTAYSTGYRLTNGD